MIKYITTIALVSAIVYLAHIQGWITIKLNYPPTFSSPTAEQQVKIETRPLDKYTFEALAKREYQSSPIILQKVLKQDKKFTSYLFTYTSENKTISGMAVLPTPTAEQNQLPIIIMLRGYVDPEIYQTGVGTWRAAEIFASQGFITLAPDFLGFGESDDPSEDVFEERFSRTVQILNLIASLNTLAQVDTTRIGLWGHSNGGQISLSLLEITEEPYPTTLWAPVSKPFPYSILYYTDDFDDRGQRLRFEIAKLEKLYDVNKYSIEEFYHQINAPILLHQGAADESVPVRWSNELAEKLREQEQEIDLTYHIYPQADHNMSGSWNTVVNRDIEFFKKHLQ